jgi:hypothetical protein
MTEIVVSPLQRLRTLENLIREGMEEFYYTGMKLKEIRDDELYKEDGFKTWTEYCRVRWEWTRRHTTQLITAAEYREKLPTGTTGSGDWSERSVRELTRLEDERAAVKVATKVLEAVEASAQKPGGKPVRLTAGTVRRFVDAELGVDRAATARETKREGGAAAVLHVFRLVQELTPEDRRSLLTLLAGRYSRDLRG